MDIRNLMQEMHEAQNEDVKEKVIEKIKSQFNSLNDLEKEEVKKSFIASLDEMLAYTKKKLEEFDLKLEMTERKNLIFS